MAGPLIKCPMIANYMSLSNPEVIAMKQNTKSDATSHPLMKLGSSTRVCFHETMPSRKILYAHVGTLPCIADRIRSSHSYH